jgi:septation ring formation regulator EzrA
MGTGFPFLFLGSLKKTVSESNKMLEKMCEAIQEHGSLYSKIGQEVADILSTVTSIAEAQNRYCLYYNGLYNIS